MATQRFFSGSRDSGGSNTSSVSAMMRAQLKKDKKINFAEINKKLLQNKLMEAKLSALTGEKKTQQSMVGVRAAPPTTEGRSKRTDAIVKMVMQREKEKAEKTALAELADYLENSPESATAEEIQTQIYEIGKNHPFSELKAWFSALYEILLGQAQGPRMGSFVKLYGRAETVKLIRNSTK